MKEIVIKPHEKFSLLDLEELWRFRDLFYIFAWRDIKVRYKQTTIGIAWVVLQPTITMLLFTILFGNLHTTFHSTLPYPIFVLIGLIFWMYFSESLTQASNAFIENEKIIKKVYFPKEILPMSAILTRSIDFLITLSLLFMIMALYGVKISMLLFITIPISYVLTSLFVMGLGLFLSSLNVKYRDVRYALPFFTQVIFFATPVIYSTEIVNKSFRYIFLLNPLSGAIEITRQAVNGSSVDYYTLIFSFFMSLLVYLGGLVYFRSTEQYLADIV